MYKGVGRAAAKNTGVFKPEAARKETHSYFFIIGFEWDGVELKRHKKVLTTWKEEIALREAEKLRIAHNLSYVAVMDKPWHHAPEIIHEVGDRSLVDLWLQKNSQNEGGKASDK